MDVKTGSLDPADFATTLCLGTSPTVAYQATSVGILRYASRDMPMVIQPLSELPTLSILIFA
jgi:hypothetical protein